METYTRMFIDCLLKQSREPNYQKKHGDTLSPPGPFMYIKSYFERKRITSNHGLEQYLVITYPALDFTQVYLVV